MNPARPEQTDPAATQPPFSGQQQLPLDFVPDANQPGHEGGLGSAAPALQEPVPDSLNMGAPDPAEAQSSEPALVSQPDGHKVDAEAEVCVLDFSSPSTSPERASVGKAMRTLLDRLKDAEGEMRCATFTIGYLQAEIDKHKEQLQHLPDFESRARKAAEIEQQYAELRRRLPELEQNARRLAALQRENKELRLQLHDIYVDRDRRRWWTVFSPRFWFGLFFRGGRAE